MAEFSQVPGIRPEFARALGQATKEFSLDDDSFRLLSRYLLRGSRAVNSLTGYEQKELLGNAVSRLTDVAAVVANELRPYGREVTIDTLVPVLRSRCGVPPFCYGSAGDDFDPRGEGDDTETAAEVPVGA